MHKDENSSGNETVDQQLSSTLRDNYIKSTAPSSRRIEPYFSPDSEDEQDDDGDDRITPLDKLFR